MNTFTFRGHTVACLITQKDFSLFDGDVAIANRVPSVGFALAETSEAAEFFGAPCKGTTVFGAATRPLAPHEIAADAVFVTAPPGAGGIQAMIVALRAAGFRGVIASPGLIAPRPDNPPGGRDVAARIATIVVQATALD
jgi:hypothetical protein